MLVYSTVILLSFVVYYIVLFVTVFLLPSASVVRAPPRFVHLIIVL